MSSPWLHLSGRLRGPWSEAGGRPFAHWLVDIKALVDSESNGSAVSYDTSVYPVAPPRSAASSSPRKGTPRTRCPPWQA